MKYSTIIILIATILLVSCKDLNLNPLSEGSSENWYTDESEIVMSLNSLYQIDLWTMDSEEWTDNWYFRNELSPVLAGTVNGEWDVASSLWTNCYKVIARANSILEGIDRAKGNISDAKMKNYIAEARFMRAVQYSTLVSHFGDVVFYTKPLSLEESFSLSRAEKAEILKSIYEDFDYAIDNLPSSYSGQLKRATKGAAMALKARIALYMGNWTVARDAAKKCMDLDLYKLHPVFGDLFLSKTKNSVETIFALPRSAQLGVLYSPGSNGYVNRMKTRNAGGTVAYNPTWDLFCSFECKDGLPIDESPLFDPRNPFKNRDPRCSATTVEFQTRHLGFMYQPHPDSINVMNYNTGKYQINNDTRSTIQWASFNGLVWKKGVDEDWIDLITDPDLIIIRYADVLLMYAEAKIELNEIDQSVLDAINKVRARAYGVDISQTSKYPALTSTNQIFLRKKVRLERRVEFANEGLRYMDLIRWHLAEKALKNKNFGMLDVADLREKVVKKGLWFFPDIPQIDEDGIPDFTGMYSAGLIKMLSQRNFDASKQYLWPIPSKERLINENLTQNSGY